MASIFRSRDADPARVKPQLQRKPRWQKLWKHQRDSSDSGESLTSESDSDSRISSSPGSTPPQLSPIVGVDECCTPQIDQFYFGMDFQSPTFPTDDTASQMVAQISDETPAPRDSLNFVEPEMLASITSYTQLSFDQYPVVMDVSTLKYVGAEEGEAGEDVVSDDYYQFDAFDEYNEDEVDLSDDDFCYTPIEVATAVPVYRPQCKAQIIKIVQNRSQPSSPVSGHSRSTSNSSIGSVDSAQFSGAEPRSSFSSYASDATSIEAFFETAQWLEKKGPADESIYTVYGDSQHDCTNDELSAQRGQVYTSGVQSETDDPRQLSVHCLVTQPTHLDSTSTIADIHRHAFVTPQPDIQTPNPSYDTMSIAPPIPARSRMLKTTFPDLSIAPPMPLRTPPSTPPAIPDRSTSRTYRDSKASPNPSLKEQAQTCAKSTPTYSLFPHVESRDYFNSRTRYTVGQAL